MVKPMFDTNVLIDYLCGDPRVRHLLDQSKQPMISMVTYSEVMVGAAGNEETLTLRRWMDLFEVVPVSPDISNDAVELQERRGIAMSDAIILATARRKGATLITRNTKSFPETELNVRTPYSL